MVQHGAWGAGGVGRRGAAAYRGLWALTGILDLSLRSQLSGELEERNDMVQCVFQRVVLSRVHLEGVGESRDASVQASVAQAGRQ